jgi:hypothetical protein
MTACLHIPEHDTLQALPLTGGWPQGRCTAMKTSLSAASLALGIVLALPAAPALAEGRKPVATPSREAAGQSFASRMNRLDALMGAPPSASLLSRAAAPGAVRRTGRIRDANAER